MSSPILSQVEFLSLEQLEAIATSLDALAAGGAADADALAATAALVRQQAAQIDLHLRSESLIAAISRRLLNAPLDALEAGVVESLAELGAAARVQRAYVFLLTDDGLHLTGGLEWVVDGVAGHDLSSFKGVSVDAFPWSMDRFRRGETVIVTDPDALPEDAAPERGACEMMTIQSYVNMPLAYGEQVMGWLGFDSVGASKMWTDAELKLMELARDVITAAILRKRREEQLFRQRELSERMLSMGILAAGIAHEINNPLAFVIGNLQYIDENLTRDHVSSARVLTALRGALTHANEGAERVRWIVEDLRSLSNGEETDRDEVRLDGVINAALRMASNQLRHRARVVRNYAGAPPVIANPSQLGQVMLNLILNAAQAIPEGHAPDNEIEIKAQGDNGDVRVEIRDTGCGIPADSLPRIFDPFYTTREVGESMGMGLAICHQIVRSLGGSISVASQVGVGTTITLRLPRARAADQAADERRPRILLIDDEELILMMLGRFLEGHELVFARNGREALDKIAESPDLDLIFCDVMMPDLSGVDVYEAVRDAYPGLERRMVFITGGSLSRATDQMLRTLPNEILMKPFSPKRIREIVAAKVEAA